MSLADRLKSGPPTSSHGTPCSIETALSALPESEAVAFQAMLDDPTWKHEAIRQVLEDEGVKVGGQTVGNHRRRQCRCFR